MAGKVESSDFEFDDPIISSPVVSKKRKTVIGLDELLADFYKEQSKNVENESKRAKAQKKRISDEVLDTKEASLSKLVDQCQFQMNEMGGEEEASLWGVQLFGDQRSSPPIAAPPLESCGLLQSFMDNELNSLVELSSENGDSFIEGLLVSGWLSKLVLTCGHVEESIARWTSDLMLYSPKEELRTSACKFWCGILSSIKEKVKIDWFPSYSEIRKALEVYGFIFLSDSEASNATSEAEELVEVIVCLFLDRQLQGLSVLLYECMQALISYFTDKEWKARCENIAKYLASRVPKNLNCIRIVECISGVDDRSKHLRSVLAYKILLGFFDNKAADDEVLRLLLAINLKERTCDLFKVYIYLVLSENWLLSNNLLEHKPVLKEMWGLYLRNCSCSISSTDLRSFAPKIRNKASFLLQGASRV